MMIVIIVVMTVRALAPMPYAERTENEIVKATLAELRSTIKMAREWKGTWPVTEQRIQRIMRECSVPKFKEFMVEGFKDVNQNNCQVCYWMVYEKWRAHRHEQREIKWKQEIAIRKAA